MLNFEPVTEEEALNLMKPGVYDFEVVFAEDVVSKKTGNPMIKLTLNVFDENGNKRNLTDYIMPSLMYKLKHFCDVAQLEEKFASGRLSADDCKNASGKCKIKTEESPGYPPKNSVQDYVKEMNVKASQADLVKKDDVPFNDDIPF